MNVFWDVVFKHCRLCTMDECYEPLENYAMGCKDGIIQWIGPTQKIPSQNINNDTKIIDAEHKVLTPGFIDCHTHLVYGGNRAKEFEMRLQGVSYQAIHAQGGGIQSTVRATREASFEVLYQQSKKRLNQLIQQGVTTVEIKSGYGLNLETEAKMLKVAQKLAEDTGVTVIKTFLGAHACPPEFDNKSDYLAEVINNMLPSLVEQGLVDAVDGFCEAIAFDKDDIENLIQAALKYQLPFKLHTEQLTRSMGTHLCGQYQALSADHLEYAQEEDIQALTKSGTVAVLLPGAFYFLKETKKPPVELLRKYKVNMALATDCNPGTSPTTSLLLMLNMGCVLFGLTPEEALYGVTVHAAKALNQPKVGKLLTGFKADCVLWDIGHPRELMYQFGDNPCRAVYKQGQIIYDHAAAQRSEKAY